MYGNRDTTSCRSSRPIKRSFRLRIAYFAFARNARESGAYRKTRRQFQSREMHRGTFSSRQDRMHPGTRRICNIVPFALRPHRSRIPLPARLRLALQDSRCLAIAPECDSADSVRDSASTFSAVTLCAL